MSQHKHLQGKFNFVAEDGQDPDDLKEQFDLIFSRLSVAFRASLRSSGADAPAAAQEEPLKQLPFAVTLSFEEASGENLIGKFQEKIEALIRRLIEAASALPGPLGLGAKIMTALDTFLNDPQPSAELKDAKTWVLDRSQQGEWTRVQKLFSQWAGSRFSDIGLGAVSKSEWADVLGKLRAAPAVAEPVPGDAEAADQTATQVPQPTGKFELTQLMGWLTAEADAGQQMTYGFNIQGVCRFADNAVIYGTWARLDVFGPDGSQLLTCTVRNDSLEQWLGGQGANDLEVDVAPSRELRAALAAPQRPRQKINTVNGRLWLSNGQPFGQRTLAIYVKPAFPQFIDDCCPPAEFEPDLCCAPDWETGPILQVPQALAVTQTDQAGYFEFSYPANTGLNSRYALLQLSGIALPLALELLYEPSAEGVSIEAQFPKPVLLQIDSNLVMDTAAQQPIDWLGDKGKDCDCQGLDFAEANRTLEEFKFDIVIRTTDPLVTRGAISDAITDDSLAQPPVKDTVVPPSQSSINRYFRVPLSRDEQITWDERPRIAQAVSIAHGRILTLRQVWRADGYSLGDLRYSLPLAPLQKKNIAVIDWDRRDTLQMESTQDYRESMFNFVGRERDISEIVNSALNESVNAHSDSGGRSGSSGFGLSLGPVGFGSASGGSSSAWSNASQNSTRTLAANFINQLRDQTVQSANALRSQRVTTVQQVNQSEAARVVTETVANRNACHAITVQYFEVLRHLRVDHELAAVRECLYIPFPLSLFTVEKALRWRGPLNQYLADEQRAGLDACARLSSNAYPHSAVYADEAIINFGLEVTITLDFPFPPGALEDTTTWQDYFGVKFPSSSPLPSLLASLKRTPAEKRATYYQDVIAPVLADKMVSALRVVCRVDGAEVALSLEPRLATRYTAGGKHKVVFAERGDTIDSVFSRRSLSAVRIYSDATIAEFNSVLVHDAECLPITAHLHSRLIAGATDRHSLQRAGTVDFTLGLRPHELIDQRLEDQQRSVRMLEHLNNNLEYYHKAIWWLMDAERRFVLLDGFIAPNASGRSVASVVENRLVAIIGNCLVMPVAPGIRLDYFDDNISEDSADRDIDEDWLLAHYRPAIPMPSTRIAVPTRGVFAESVMGSCNGCEKIDNSRNWQYWQHPLPDEPTAIEPVSLDSRDKDPVVAGAQPMPAAIINQVATSVPPAPDPTGLGAAIAAVTNGAAFRDATGLAGTQQNSREALSQSYATTQKFGELGAELSKKQIDASIEAMKMVASAYGIPVSLLDTASKVKDEISKDAAAGRITTQQGQEQTAQVNNKLIEQLNAAAPASLPDTPVIQEAIKSAIQGGAPVSVRRADGQVDVGAPTVRSSAAAKGSWFWPFTAKREASASARSSKPRLPLLKIEVVTAIRDVGGAAQVGEKSRHVLTLDCENRTFSAASPTTGKTTIYGWSLDSTRNAFTATLDDASGDVFAISTSGQTASGVRFMPDIDYRFRLTIDAQRKQIRIQGAHDGFPSYTLLLNGKAIYDYQQSPFLQSVPKLFGTGDVTVEKTVSF
ncbi:hypothetical protein ACIOVF_26130 [Pseudomonas sp. NPDC087612]|uniref:hypothetical protein n=1 Tax=Pseudomonas sp. NPDC087612 TaxID=3364441 RepID=UPI003809649B